MVATTEEWSGLPEPWRGRVSGQLEPGEQVVAVFRPDLDEALCFQEGLLVLTGRRFIDAGDRARAPRAWPIETLASLTESDRAGLGTLEALGPEDRLGRWRYTVGLAKQAKRFVDAFAALRAGVAPAPVAEQPGDGAEIPEAAAHEAPPRIGTLFRLLAFARRHVGALALGMALSLGSTAAGLVPPYLTWPLVDEVLTPYQEQVKVVRADPSLSGEQQTAKLEKLREQGRGPFGKVPFYLAGMLAAALAAWGLAWAQGWVLARLSERISADLRNTTYEHLHKLSLEFFSAKRTGDLMSRISSDTDRICYFLADTLMDFLSDVLMILGTMVILFYMDPVLALATLCTFPLVGFLTFYIRRRLNQGFLAGSRAWAEMTSILADTIPGVRVVKAFAQETRETDRFKSANDRIVAANDRTNRLWTFFWPLVALLNQIGVVVAWAFGAWRVFDQQITVGVLTAFLAYIARFFSRLESMTRMVAATQRAAASAQRIFDILDRAPSVPEPARPVSPGRLQGAIEVRGASFRFGNRPVVSDVDLKIRPGEMIGLVGPTGAGKSTLLNLVCRFYDPSEGSVLVDGQDIRSFPICEYRRNIGMVLQEPFLFYGTIADNISYGRPDATRQEIIAAARAARAHEFIMQLPDGYDSVVGERGQTLSGGERQRISIARALLIDPRILILDEATSSVDTQTERQIQEALDYLVQGRTTIAIAHRLSTLRNADRLIVLEQGRIVETGNHAELMAARGLYASLYEAQQRDNVKADAVALKSGTEPVRPPSTLAAESVAVALKEAS